MLHLRCGVLASISQNTARLTQEHQQPVAPDFEQIASFTFITWLPKQGHEVPETVFQTPQLHAG